MVIPNKVMKFQNVDEFILKKLWRFRSVVCLRLPRYVRVTMVTKQINLCFMFYFLTWNNNKKFVDLLQRKVD